MITLTVNKSVWNIPHNTLSTWIILTETRFQQDFIMTENSFVIVQDMHWHLTRGPEG